jgi:hypothetical protein
METQLAMKSSSFTVKDILDLPEGKASCSPIGGLDTTSTVHSHGGTLTIPSVPDVHDLPSVPNYYDSENPYTRWLQTNDTMHYRK